MRRWAYCAAISRLDEIALGVDGHGRVLEGASGKPSPVDWARRAVVLYHRSGADRIVAEANQDGAPVEATIRTVDSEVSFEAAAAIRNDEVGEINVELLTNSFGDMHKFHALMRGGS